MTVVPSAGPYVGLRHYEADEADIFFGRDAETVELTTLVLGNRLVVLYGHAGAGKSSLLRAGMMAGLAGRASVLPVGRAAIPAGLEADANPFVYGLLSSWAPHLPERVIRRLTITEFARGLDTDYDRYGSELPLVAIIDQFEELFANKAQFASERATFLEQLAHAVKSVARLHLVLSTNEEAVGEVLPYEPQLSGGDLGRYRLLPLQPEEAVEAVTRPLATTPRTFAPGVADALIEQLRTTTITNALGVQTKVLAPVVEPASLQVVCTALWQGLPDGVTTITFDHWRAYGDVEAALTDLCARAVADVATIEDFPESVLWKWLEDTFVTDLGTRGMAYEGLDSTAGMPHSVARAFEKRWILRSIKRPDSSVWFELQHDGLIDPIRKGRMHATDADGVDADPVERTPSSPLRMAEAALAEGMLTLAEEYADRAAAESVDDAATSAEARWLLGEILVQQAQDASGDRAEQLYRDAEAQYRSAMQLFQARGNSAAVARVLVALGRLHRMRGQITEALTMLTGALDRRRGDVDVYLEMARATEELDQLVPARGHYTSALEVAPDNVEALVGRAAVLARLSDPSGAVADIDRAISLEPGLALSDDVTRVRKQVLRQQESSR